MMARRSHLRRRYCKEKYQLSFPVILWELCNSVTLSSGDFNAVLSALYSDSRFRVVSQPSLRVRSGKEATINVGAEVPVLGSLSYPQGAGRAVQSVEYRNSGVIFTIISQVREAVVDLSVDQQPSNFVRQRTVLTTVPHLLSDSLRLTFRCVTLRLLCLAA